MGKVYAPAYFPGVPSSSSNQQHLDEEHLDDEQLRVISSPVATCFCA